MDTCIYSATRVPKGFGRPLCTYACVNKGRLIGLITKHELAASPGRLRLSRTASYLRLPFAACYVIAVDNEGGRVTPSVVTPKRIVSQPDRWLGRGLVNSARNVFSVHSQDREIVNSSSAKGFRRVGGTICSRRKERLIRSRVATLRCPSHGEALGRCSPSGSSLALSLSFGSFC